MLEAQQVFVKGRHEPLVPTTSLTAPTDRLTIAVADAQVTRTAFALTLSGRMKPTSGGVLYDGEDSLRTLRLHTGLVDAVGVNEPEQQQRLRDIAEESLGLIPRRFCAERSASAWLHKHDFEDCASEFIDQVSPGTRLRFLCELALTDTRVDTLVVDSPERHTGEVAQWLPYLEQLSQDLTVAVMASFAPVSARAAAYRIGDDAERTDAPKPAGEHSSPRDRISLADLYEPDGDEPEHYAPADGAATDDAATAEEK